MPYLKMLLREANIIKIWHSDMLKSFILQVNKTFHFLVSIS